MNTLALRQQVLRRHARPFTMQPPKRCRLTVMNSADIRGAKMEKGMFGEDFGARDPTVGEIETGFGEKVLGNYNTEHIIKPPDHIRMFIGLSSKRCQDNVGNLQLVTDEQRELLRAQAPGWRVTTTPGGKQCIRYDWKMKDEAAAVQFAGMVKAVAQDEGHLDSLVLGQVSSEVTAQLSTASLGGLTENDFIVACKINDLDVKDLLMKKKPKFWA